MRDNTLLTCLVNISKVCLIEGPSKATVAWLLLRCTQELALLSACQSWLAFTHTVFENKNIGRFWPCEGSRLLFAFLVSTCFQKKLSQRADRASEHPSFAPKI